MMSQAASAYLVGALVTFTALTLEADEPEGARLCIPLARAFVIAESHRANGAMITVLTDPEEVGRWYEVVERSAGEDDETPVFVIVIDYPVVSYAYLGDGPAVCRGAEIPGWVSRKAFQAARGYFS